MCNILQYNKLVMSDDDEVFSVIKKLDRVKVTDNQTGVFPLLYMKESYPSLEEETREPPENIDDLIGKYTLPTLVKLSAVFGRDFIIRSVYSTHEIPDDVLSKSLENAIFFGKYSTVKLLLRIGANYNGRNIYRALKRSPFQSKKINRLLATRLSESCF